MESKDLNQLKTDVIRVEIEFERLERKVDGIQNDLTALRRDFEMLRGEVRGVKEDVQALKTEMRAGFDNLERIVLRAIRWEQ